MLNSGNSSSYKALLRKTPTRECQLSEKPVSEIIVDFRSRLFRYIRLVYTNRTQQDKARSIFRAIKELRLTGDVVGEKRRVFASALTVTRKELKFIGPNCKHTYVFGSKENCPLRQHKSSENRLFELKKYMSLYAENMFDLRVLEQCAKALESYVISDLESISTLYSGKEWILGIGRYRVPGKDDMFESDRLCARLAKSGRGAAVLSEDFDNVMLFGADMMIKEIHANFFMYVSMRDTMAMLGSLSRADAIHRSCIMGTDYNKGLLGVGPVKAKKIDASEAKRLFHTCLDAQSINPAKLYELFGVNVK